MRPRISLLVLTLVLVACRGDRSASSSEPPPPSPATKDAGAAQVTVDIYGTSQISQAEVIATLSGRLQQFAETGDLGYRLEIQDAIMAMGDFAQVSLSLVTYHDPTGPTRYLTIDVVDSADLARRMPFGVAPDGYVEDPDGLLAAWQAYEAKHHELLTAGSVSPERVACAAFHCLGDHTHPDLAPLAARFATAGEHLDALGLVLRDDRDSSRRAAAAYLIAYGDDGADVVRRLVSAFRDPSTIVRNAAMRVVAEIAFHHPDVAVPLEPVLAALEYPATTDRNKASAILSGLLDQKGSTLDRPHIARRSGRTLLAMLRLQQPNNHDFAYRILKALSGANHGPRDYAAWQRWLTSLEADPG